MIFVGSSRLNAFYLRVSSVWEFILNWWARAPQDTMLLEGHLLQESIVMKIRIVLEDDTCEWLFDLLSETIQPS